jgi:hypothetical protein
MLSDIDAASIGVGYIDAYIADAKMHQQKTHTAPTRERG